MKKIKDDDDGEVDVFVVLLFCCPSCSPRGTNILLAIKLSLTL